jgi:glutamate/tyrosine decarboxylase-like PLP-dependent enzyme
MSIRSLLDRTARHAAAFVDSIETRPIAPASGLDELRAALGRPLPDGPTAAEQVVDELVQDAGGGLLASGSGRFFGWVIGGSLPAALAADWLTAAWDQNAASYACGPAEAVVEEVCGAWLKDLLHLPDGASFGLVTGCQLAHVTALAAARHRLLAARGVDVERDGLCGAPAIRLLTTEQRHGSLVRAVRLLGLGDGAIELVPHDGAGRIRPAAVVEALGRRPGAPPVVCLQAGDINTGIFDPFAEVIPLAHDAGAWVHVDGAFGLWAATCERYRGLLAGAERADSWATDGHKWLNVPFDCGFVFCAHPLAHAAALAIDEGYLVAPEGDARDQKSWNPEWSRRGRGFAVYAAIRSLGRQGIAEIVDRCCRCAARLVAEIGALPGVEVLAEPVLNQGLVRFMDPAGDHDRRTEEVIRRIQAAGVAWFGPTTWRGRRAMRISVVSWRTSDGDVDRTVASVRAVLERAPDATPAG